jgi:hypothetical protein
MEIGVIAPLILNLNTKLRRVVSLTFRLPYYRVNYCQRQLDRGLVGSRASLNIVKVRIGPTGKRASTLKLSCSQ